MSFTYRHGDRPLDGYTILRGIGRGGFGEVYYAVSDGGREVALKAIHQNHEIELRGARHCMNLKSPQLVTIFDVHESQSGPPFIVMEYIEGPSLRDLLEQSPGGVPEEKAAFLVREIAKGLAYLHENGIVHRDLKPENLFYEDGYVKIGDYGLSKFISASRQSGQTISVGTVHYMAPEIGSGNYQRGIDIYALGVILYELLTGKVPFEGRNLGEILMKHLSAAPDVSRLSPRFQNVVRKALEKRPEDRYADASELAAELLADRTLGERVSRLRPADFSQYTARHASEADDGRGLGPSRGVGLGETMSVGAVAPASVAPSAPWAHEPRAGSGHETESGSAPIPSRGALAEFASSETGSRLVLCAATIAMATTLLHLLVPVRIWSPASVFFYLGSITAGVASVLLVERWAIRRFRLDSGFARRTAVTVGAGSLLVPGFAVLVATGSPSELIYSYLSPFLVGIFCVNWHERVRRDRPERLLLGAAFGAAVGGLLLALLFGVDGPLVVAGVLGSISLALNVGAPFGAPSKDARRPDRPGRADAAGARRSVARHVDAAKAHAANAVASTSSVWQNIAELKERMRTAARSTPNVQLIRPRREAILGGVCAGLARYMDVSSFAVRVTFFLFAVLTWGWALLAYLIFWIKIPAAEGFEIARGTAAAESSRVVREALSSSFASYLLIVLGFGGGSTLLIGVTTGESDLLGLGLDFEVAVLAGCFLLAVGFYRLLEVVDTGRRSFWRSLPGGLVYLSLVALGLNAVRLLVTRMIPGTGAGLGGWSVAITWAVILLSARLAIQIPGQLLSGFSPVARTSDPGQPPRATAWGLLGTTLVLAGTLIAFAGVATTTGLAEAVFIKLDIERYAAFIEFGQHREHFLIGLVLFLPGLFCHLAARRWGGGLHVLRGTVGLVGAGLVFGVVALFAPEFVRIDHDFDVVLARPLGVEPLVSIYLLLILSFGCLKWPGRSAQWRGAAPLAPAAGGAV